MMATFPNPEKQKRAQTAKPGALPVCSSTTTKEINDAFYHST
jgi:hypothetical protein